MADSAAHEAPSRNDIRELDTGSDAAIDRLSLEQALRDVEIANGRVVDLTSRLLSVSEELADTRRELDVLQSDHDGLIELHLRMKGSHAFRLADRIWALRNLLRR